MREINGDTTVYRQEKRSKLCKNRFACLSQHWAYFHNFQDKHRCHLTLFATHCGILAIKLYSTINTAINYAFNRFNPYHTPQAITIWHFRQFTFCKHISITWASVAKLQTVQKVFLSPTAVQCQLEELYGHHTGPPCKIYTIQVSGTDFRFLSIKIFHLKPLKTLRLVQVKLYHPPDRRFLTLCLLLILKFSRQWWL